MRNYFLGVPPKPSGGSRGFGGESRSSGMRELSPSGGSERYGACDDEGVRNYLGPLKRERRRKYPPLFTLHP